MPLNIDNVQNIIDQGSDQGSISVRCPDFDLQNKIFTEKNIKNPKNTSQIQFQINEMALMSKRSTTQYVNAIFNIWFKSEKIAWI